MLDLVKDSGLAVDVLFSDYMGGESRADAVAAVEHFDDPRVRFFWDEGRRVGRLLGAQLGPFPERPVGEQDLLWDAYVLWGPGAQLTADRATPPVLWMHQLWGVPESQAPKLDTAVLKGRLTQLLSEG